MDRPIEYETGLDIRRNAPGQAEVLVSGQHGSAMIRVEVDGEGTLSPAQRLEAVRKAKLISEQAAQYLGNRLAAGT